MHLFKTNQTHFSTELEKMVSNEERKDFSNIVSKIKDGMKNGQLPNTITTLAKENPEKSEKIQALGKKAIELLETARKNAIQEIEKYVNKLKPSFNWIFKKCPDLEFNYQKVFQGQYESLSEIPQGSVFSGKISEPTYLDRLTKLLKQCKKFENSTDQYQPFQIGLNEYCEVQFKDTHFQKRVAPLVKLSQILKNILKWPKEFELAKSETKYILNNLQHFLGISSTNMGIPAYVPFDFLTISEDKKKAAITVFKKPKSTYLEKRKACRLLLHSRIPWSSLKAIADLLHRSGGISEEKAKENQQIVTDALLELLVDLQYAEKAICALVDFECTELKPFTPIFEPKQIPTDRYSNIHLLAQINNAQKNMEKMLDVLGSWRNRPLLAVDFNLPKNKFAILRTIQVLGEACKNLQNIGMLGNDEVWNILENLRDLFSHSERTSVYKRLVLVINDPNATSLLSAIMEDFRTLREFFEEKLKLFNQQGTWVERKKIQKKLHQVYIELGGLEDLYIFLTNKISEENQETLKKTLDDQNCINAREEISKIKSHLLTLPSTSSNHNADIEKLPLTKGQKHAIKEGFKVLFSQNAAMNNLKNLKLASVKKITSMISDLKKVKNLDPQILKLIDLLINEVNSCSQPINAHQSPDLQVKKIKDLIEQIKQLWKSEAKQFEQINEQISSLLETQEEFVDRKKDEIKDILNEIKTFQSKSEVEDIYKFLIKKMQMGHLSNDALKLHLTGLGVCVPSQKLWITIYDKSKKISTQKTADDNQNSKSFEEKKKKCITCIDFILERFKSLDALLNYSASPKKFEEFSKDSILQLSCQYLVADFRSNASVLEDNLEFLKHYYDPKFFQEIQQQLSSTISMGNSILHIHDATQSNTLTPHGHIFILFYQTILKFLTNLSGGKDHNVQILSLNLKLKKLKEMLSGSF